ncbi:MAG: hypothetical protein K2Q09_07815, partial [Phycisphaerales bacterium]|nr:hypothetical protein [Phycisphaerales bacterium]
VLVLAREPTTRAGLCPLVAVGPVTVRAFVAEPPQPGPRPGSKSRKKTGRAAPPPADAPVSMALGPYPPPTAEWLLAACEALGDAAIAQVTSPLAAERAIELHSRLQSFPDHEKLHQRLMEACETAVREPKRRKPAPPIPDELEDLTAEPEPGGDLSAEE